RDARGFRLASVDCRAFDSLAPARSPCGLPVYIARRPPAPFCETPTFWSDVRRRRPTASPFQYGARPGEPTPEDNHEHIITPLDAPSAIGFVECNRHGRSGGVAVAVQIHKHFVARNAEPVGDRFNDAQIGLMRNDTGDVLNGKPGLSESLFRSLQHRRDSLFVHFLARHVDRRQMHIHVLSRDGAPRATARHEQNVCILTVAADVRADYAMSAASVAQYGRAGAISKKHASVAI